MRNFKLQNIVFILSISVISFAAGSDDRVEAVERIKRQLILKATTGKPKEFLNKDDVSAAKQMLSAYYKKSAYAFIGKFIKIDASVFIEDAASHGGGYYVHNFLAREDLKAKSNIEKLLQVRVQKEFILLSEESYYLNKRDEIYKLFSKFVSNRDQFYSGSIAKNVFEKNMRGLQDQIRRVDYEYQLQRRLRSYQDLSLSNNSYVLFLSKLSDNTYSFENDGIFPIGKGTFVDILLGNQSQTRLESNLNK